MVPTALSDSDTQLLTELTKHPGWALLARIVKEQSDRRALAVAKQLLHTLEPLDQNQLFYDRGYWKAMNDLITRPERAARQTSKEQVIT